VDRRFRHYVFRTDGGYEMYTADSPHSMADDGFDSRIEARRFIVDQLVRARDSLNEELRRARFNLRHEAEDD
jgi:hypothetical protein